MIGRMLLLHIDKKYTRKKKRLKQIKQTNHNVFNFKLSQTNRAERSVVIVVTEREGWGGVWFVGDGLDGNSEQNDLGEGERGW